jgi:hypothetical protein
VGALRLPRRGPSANMAVLINLAVITIMALVKQRP